MGTSLFTSCLLAGVAFYRVTLSYLLGGRCRFVPSCSRYAQIALRRHGAARGMHLAIRRLLSCHPWHVGGLDRVPAKAGASQQCKGRVPPHNPSRSRPSS